MFDIILVSVFVFGAAAYLFFRLRKKLRSLHDPHASSGCGCGCECSRKSAIPPHLRKKSK